MAKDEEAKEEAEAKGGKKKLIIMVIPVLLLVAGAGWYFFLRSDDSGAPVVLPEPTPGAVVKLEPITVNLAAGHFLKFGMAIQPTATATEVDGSKALDLAISEFSQMTMDELSDPEGRAKSKEELIARIKLTYLPEGTDLAAATSSTTSTTKKETAATAEKEEIHIADRTEAQVLKMAKALTVQPEVYDVYFTEFVMQ